ncbi:hypothetical protein L209DRAFT_755862, partial [Thermothelomyces heterothallicus CBS 203.75]
MRFAALLTAFFAAAQAEKDYFFRYSGGNDIIDHQRLRSNISIQHTSPGVTLPPYNPKDRKLRVLLSSKPTNAQRGCDERETKKKKGSEV